MNAANISSYSLAYYSFLCVCLSVCLSVLVGVRANFFSILARKIFRQRPKKTAMLTCKITLPDSPYPVIKLIISKNPGIRALYLAGQNEFRFFFL